MEEVEADQEILNLTSDLEAQTQKWLDQPIGKIEGDMVITDSFSVRTCEHPAIEFINKVQMQAAGVDISTTSLFNNLSPGFGTNVTMRDIISNYMFPNTLKVLCVSGQDIKDALEQSASYFMLNETGNLEVNPAFIHPKPQHYNYDMWEGIEYVLDIRNPIGKRVTTLTYKGEPLHLDGKYPCRDE